jgi:hypothetical protein
MPEQGQQFNCPQCGEPQFTADFGFSKHYHPTEAVKDPCLYCGESTAPGGMNMVDRNNPSSVHDVIKNIPLMNPKFISRIGGTFDPHGNGEEIQGYVCADCAGYECDGCGKQIRLDEDITDKQEWGHYHPECLEPSKHYVDPDEPSGKCGCYRCSSGGYKFFGQDS